MKLKWTDYLYLPWTLWCVVVTVMVSILAFPLLFICIASRIKKLEYFAHFIPNWAANIILFWSGVRIEVHGLDNFDPEVQYVFVGNHRSYLDAFVAVHCIPNYKKFIGKAELLRVPIVGYLLRKLYIPVHRNDKDSRKWSMEQLFEKTKEGASMVVFPEGTTNAGHEYLLPFKEGAFKLSMGSNIPMVVMTCIGAGELWHRNSLHIIKPGKLKVFFSKPMNPQWFQVDQIENYKAEVIKEIESHLKVYYPNGYQ